MQKLLFKLLPAMHVFIYRLTRGALGGKVWGMDVLLLTTTGRRSGKDRTTPLSFLSDDGAYVVVGSNGGRASDPAWVRNIQNNPRVTLQVKGDRFPASAVFAGPSDRARLWARVIEIAPPYADYAKATTREIPLVVMRRLVA
jgi:deazaflavin-dependent oxidoreductase (nitroreductase family)